MSHLWTGCRNLYKETKVCCYKQVNTTRYDRNSSQTDRLMLLTCLRAVVAVAVVAVLVVVVLCLLSVTPAYPERQQTHLITITYVRCLTCQSGKQRMCNIVILFSISFYKSVKHILSFMFVYSSLSSYLDLFGCQVFGSPEYVALGAAFTSQLMDLNHFTVSYQPNKCVWWQQAQGHLQRFLQHKHKLQVLFNSFV